MNHCTLVQFLDGQMPQLQFSREISPEVLECTAALKTAGHGRIFITDGPDTVLTRARARRLLQAVADKVLSSEAASYVADCIIMSHTFLWEDDSVGEAIHFLADGDTWPLSEAGVRTQLSALG